MTSEASSKTAGSKAKMVVAVLYPFAENGTVLKNPRSVPCVGLKSDNHTDHWPHGLVKESDLTD